MPQWREKQHKSAPHNGPIGGLILGALLAFGGVACDGPSDQRPPTVSDLPALPEQLSQTEVPRGPNRADAVSLRIAFQAEVRGEFEPCGCPTLAYGGFVRRERRLEQLRAETTPLLHLDGGDLVLKGRTTEGYQSRSGRAGALMALSKQVGVDAWAPGPADLVGLGQEGFMALVDRPDPAMPAISATWVHPDGQPMLPPSTVVERAGIRVGVIGLSAEPAGNDFDGFLRMVDPVLAAQAAVASLPPVDLVVGLGTLSDDEANRVAQQVPGISLLLTSKGSQVDEPRAPLREDGLPGALVVESPDRGRYLTEVSVRVGSTAEQPASEAAGRDAWLRLRTTQSQVLQAPNDPHMAADLVRQQAEFDNVGRGRNLAFVQQVPLSKELDGEAGSARGIAAYKEKIEQRAKARAAATPPPTEPGYATAGSCARCHTAEVARWSFSDHARAWESLQLREATKNPDCAGCHSTGFGEPGGYGELSTTKSRSHGAVQCEECHGPMRGHPQDQRVVSLPVNSDRCIGCHDEANSPDFDFVPYLRRATCQGGSPE